MKSLGLVDANYNIHLEGTRNEVLLYSTGNSIQSLGIEYDGREYEKRVGHYAILQKWTQHCKSTVFNKKKRKGMSPVKDI